MRQDSGCLYVMDACSRAHDIATYLSRTCNIQRCMVQKDHDQVLIGVRTRATVSCRLYCSTCGSSVVGSGHLAVGPRDRLMRYPAKLFHWIQDSDKRVVYPSDTALKSMPISRRALGSCCIPQLGAWADDTSTCTYTGVGPDIERSPAPVLGPYPPAYTKRSGEQMHISVLG